MNAQVRSIVIEFSTDGSTEIDAKGFVGSQCSLPVRELALVLTGGTGEGADTRPKPDFYATNPGTNFNNTR